MSPPSDRHKISLVVGTGGSVVRTGDKFTKGAEQYKGQPVPRFAMYLAVCSCGGSDGRWFKGGATGPNALVKRQAAKFSKGHRWRSRLTKYPELDEMIGGPE